LPTQLMSFVRAKISAGSSWGTPEWVSTGAEIDRSTITGNACDVHKLTSGWRQDNISAIRKLTSTTRVCHPEECCDL